MTSGIVDHNERPGPFELVLVVLSIYVLLALAVEATANLTEPTKQILNAVDSAICVLFLIDFFWRLARSRRKLQFLKWGWIDFISSIPALHMFRWGRMVRVVRVVRILRGVRSTKTLLAFVFENKAKGTLASVVLTCILLLTFSSVAIVHVETDPDSNIRNAGDALWWSLATITTVGYGDRFPTTAEGRLIGVLLMTAGIALFAVLTGYIASWFSEQSSGDAAKLKAEVAALTEEVRRLRGELAETVRNST